LDTAPVPARILVCDDHKVLADLLALEIDRDPELVLVRPPVHSPEEALKACIEHRPDVVLMDVSFPGSMSGIEATRLIKEVSPGTSVLVMSGYDDPRVSSEAVRAGAAGLVSKSEDMEVVLAAAKAAARSEGRRPSPG
jgi:DNA-binding NarL/FixJ family response regulator